MLPNQEEKEETRTFLLTKSELIKIRGHHDLGSWHVSCAGCNRQFTEEDLGETIVSVPRKKPRHAPRLYFHMACFNSWREEHE